MGLGGRVMWLPWPVQWVRWLERRADILAWGYWLGGQTKEGRVIASNVKAETLQHAAEVLGLVLDMTTLNTKGTRHRVKVNLGRVHRERGEIKPGKDGEGNYSYQRISRSMFQNERRVHAVCWHGFRDYFREVFKVEPGAIFKTQMDTWKGSEDFEARFRASGHRNVGSQMAPVMAAECCRCGEEGMAR
jgi:hypothetical protein